MALSRGMMLGLAGGLVPSDPFRLSKVGEAWTVILCSKPAKQKLREVSLSKRFHRSP